VNTTEDATTVSERLVRAIRRQDKDYQALLKRRDADPTDKWIAECANYSLGRRDGLKEALKLIDPNSDSATSG
jgi:hypothetical protein